MYEPNSIKALRAMRKKETDLLSLSDDASDE